MENGLDRGAVIPVDFGKDARQSARTLARLIGVVSEFEDDMLRDPKKYYDKAVSEIVRLQGILDDAVEAGTRPFNWEAPSAEPQRYDFRTVVVPAEDYEALQRVAEIVMRWRDA